MANTRPVTFHLERPDGTPWEDGVMTFELTNHSFVSGITFPRAQITAEADENGDGTAELWVNTEGLIQTHWRFTLPSGESGEFDLPPGETAISLTVLRAAGILAGNWTRVDLENYTETYRTDIFDSLRNTTNPNLGDKQIGVKQAGALATGTTVHEFLSRFLYASDHGAVADGSTNVALAVAECLSIAKEGDWIIIDSTTAGTAYHWSSTVTWNKRVNLMILGNVTVGTAAMIRANVSNVTISGYGATITHTPASGAQTFGLVFYRKDTGTPMFDVAQHNTNWTFKGIRFVNVTLRITKIGRQNVRLPLIYTLLTATLEAGESVLHVREVPANVSTDMYARILRTDGVVEAQQIQSFDAVAKTITTTAPFTGAAPVNRRVTAFTRATTALTLGQTVIPVALDDTANLLPVGSYASVVLTPTRTHVSLISARGTNTVTLATGVPVAVAATDTLISGLNDGTTPSGTDLSECYIVDCTFSHCRANYTVEIGGGRDTTIERCLFHDIIKWNNANDARYFTEVDPTTVYSNINPYAAVWDIYHGECIKGTAATLNLRILNCTFRRWVRDAIDLFASGNAHIDGCTFEDSFWGFALEAKFGPNDVTTPVPYTFTRNTIRRLPNYGILAGVPHALIDGNTFESIGWAPDNVGTAIYLNGGHGAGIGAADEEEEVDAGSNASYSTNIRCTNNRIAGCVASGIILTEVSESNISQNQITAWGTYPIFVGAKALKNNISDNTVVHPTAPATTYIRVAGTVGTPSLHRFDGNQSDAFSTVISVDATEIPSFYLINNVGTVAAGVGATPDATNWPQGAIVINTSDTPDTVWLRYGASSILRIA